jgi:hypothetical protein
MGIISHLGTRDRNNIVHVHVVICFWEGDLLLMCED